MRSFSKRNSKTKFCVEIFLYEYPDDCHRKRDEKPVYDFFMMSENLKHNSKAPKVYNIPEDILDHHPLSMEFILPCVVKPKDEQEQIEKHIPDRIKMMVKKVEETLRVLEDSCESSTNQTQYQTSQSKVKDPEMPTSYVSFHPSQFESKAIGQKDLHLTPSPDFQCQHHFNIQATGLQNLQQQTSYGSDSHNQSPHYPQLQSHANGLQNLQLPLVPHTTFDFLPKSENNPFINKSLFNPQQALSQQFNSSSASNGALPVTSQASDIEKQNKSDQVLKQYTPVTAENVQFKCEICDRSFPKKHGLFTHFGIFKDNHFPCKVR